MSNEITKSARSQTFLEDGTWVCPGGVSFVILIGYGSGGSGGGGGAASTTSGDSACGGGGGGGAQQSVQFMAVTPGTSYAVTIGASVAGGAVQTSGNDGNTTGFGGVIFFRGGQAGTSSNATTVSTARVHLGGGPVAQIDNRYFVRIDVGTTNTSAELFNQLQPGSGGGGYNQIAAGGAGIESPFGSESVQSFQGGYGGASGATNTRLGGGGGGGGGGGPEGNGGDGGAGGAGSAAGTGGTGGNGVAAGANTGAGGGGGGAGGQGAVAGTSGTGGASGSGKLTVIWFQ